MTLSKLRAMENIVLQASHDLDKAKHDLVQEVKQNIVSNKDKMRLCMNIARCGSVIQLQSLFYNSLLKYEGLGVI